MEFFTEPQKGEMSKEEMLIANELMDLKIKIKSCKNLQEVQMLQLPFASGESELYMVGLYNGMELVNAILEDRRPEFCGILPKEQEEGEQMESSEEGGKIEPVRTISGVVKGERNEKV